MPIDTEGWRAETVNNRINYIFHAKRSISGSLLNFYLSMLGPINGKYDVLLIFFIIISVINVPFSVLLTFLSMNIPVLNSLVCSSTRRGRITCLYYQLDYINKLQCHFSSHVRLP